jgi:hypothetical protein
MIKSVVSSEKPLRCTEYTERKHKFLLLIIGYQGVFGPRVDREGKTSTSLFLAV